MDGESAMDCLSDRLLDIVELDDKIKQSVVEPIRGLLLSSIQTEGPNVNSRQQLKEVAAVLAKIDPVNAVHWMAEELAKLPKIRGKPDRAYSF